MTDVPFAIGEEFASKWQFLPYIERGIHQFNRIDVCNVGGLTEAMKVAGWSEAHYVDMMPHNPLGPICTAATVHFAAAVAELLLARDPRLARRDSISASTTPSSSRCSRSSRARSIRSATRPGLGVEVDEELVKKQSFKFWEAPHLQAPRRLGHQLVVRQLFKEIDNDASSPDITRPSKDLIDALKDIGAATVAGTLGHMGFRNPHMVGPVAQNHGQVDRRAGADAAVPAAAAGPLQRGRICRSRDAAPPPRALPGARRATWSWSTRAAT